MGMLGGGGGGGVAGAGGAGAPLARRWLGAGPLGKVTELCLQTVETSVEVNVLGHHKVRHMGMALEESCFQECRVHGPLGSPQAGTKALESGLDLVAVIGDAKRIGWARACHCSQKVTHEHPPLRVVRANAFHANAMVPIEGPRYTGAREVHGQWHSQELVLEDLRESEAYGRLELDRLLLDRLGLVEVS